MKVNSKMTSIMGMADIFIQMATITQECGKMESGQVGENQSTKVVKYMKECGSIVNLLVTEE